MMSARRDFLKAVAGAGAALPAITALGDAAGGKDIRFTANTKRLKLRHTWTIARDSTDYKDNVFVCIERDGVTGWGEAAPSLRYGETAEKTMTALEQAKEIFLSGDWFAYTEMRRRWEEVITAQSCACAALDMALLDWVGHKLNVPLYRLFGLDPSKAPASSFSIGIDTAEMVRRKVKEAPDFPYLKIKVGLDNDEEILGVVRELTDRPLRVDANEGWRDKHEALDKCHWLESLGVDLIEQPMPATMLEETGWLRERVDAPIVADEAVKSTRDIPKLAEAYDGINIKLMKSGGIQEALQMIHLARAFGMKIMLGCMVSSSVSISAAAQLTPLVDYADLDGNLLITNDPFVGIDTAHGRFHFSEEPGLGVRPRPTT